MAWFYCKRIIIEGVTCLLDAIAAVIRAKIHKNFLSLIVARFMVLEVMLCL